LSRRAEIVLPYFLVFVNYQILELFAIVYDGEGREEDVTGKLLQQHLAGCVGREFHRALKMDL
jgi:hypothetical protein